MFFDDEVRAAAVRVLDRCRAAKLRVVTAESLTGGSIAAALTEIPGSSDVVDRALVVYTYDAKTQLLAVPADLLAARGAVDRDVVEAMARGALAAAHPYAHLAVAVTGVAGPGPSDGKPAGTVFLAVARRGRSVAVTERAYGAVGRDAVRRATVLDALGLLHDAAD